MNQPYVTQEDFSRLEARVSAAEQDVDGERLLSRYILSQARQNGDDLAAVKTRLDRVEQKIDLLEQRLGRVETDVVALRKELPAIVADAMRMVLQGQQS
jgi:septal ring factor EnvC (AmiA/AmiB activator)